MACEESQTDPLAGAAVCNTLVADWLLAESSRILGPIGQRSPKFLLRANQNESRRHLIINIMYNIESIWSTGGYDGLYGLYHDRIITPELVGLVNDINVAS